MQKRNTSKTQSIVLQTKNGNLMTDKGMSVGLPAFLSLVTWWASDSGKDQGVSGNRTPRERMGIEMKSKGPKWVKPLLKTKEL